MRLSQIFSLLLIAFLSIGIRAYGEEDYNSILGLKATSTPAAIEAAYQKFLKLDYYKILGLEPTATPADIEAAYRRYLGLRPDFTPAQLRRRVQWARMRSRIWGTKFEVVQHAFRILRDPELRREYDAAGPLAELDYYKVLGVPVDASWKKVHEAYRALAKINHPDRSQDPKATGKFRVIARAYEVLHNPAKRMDYYLDYRYHRNVKVPKFPDPTPEPRDPSTTGRVWGLFRRRADPAREAKQKFIDRFAHTIGDGTTAGDIGIEASRFVEAFPRSRQTEFFRGLALNLLSRPDAATLDGTVRIEKIRQALVIYATNDPKGAGKVLRDAVIFANRIHSESPAIKGLADAAALWGAAPKTDRRTASRFRPFSATWAGLCGILGNLASSYHSEM